MKPLIIISGFIANKITESIKRLKIQIEALKNNIQSAKTHFDSNVIDDLIDYLYKTIQKEKEKEFLKSHEKATKIVARPFIARQNKNLKQINKQNSVSIDRNIAQKTSLKNKDKNRSRNDINYKRKQTKKSSNSNNYTSNYAINHQTRATNSKTNKIRDVNFRQNRQEAFYEQPNLKKRKPTDYNSRYNKNDEYSRNNKIHNNRFYEYSKDFGFNNRKRRSLSKIRYDPNKRYHRHNFNDSINQYSSPFSRIYNSNYNHHGGSSFRPELSNSFQPYVNFPMPYSMIQRF
ncbi:unnamed protein product [Brachionus calyciflorus]|uniref:Uncharacterized protein n=1 Tax=Brachionus calyciflorus TaxID=104777 RepID=A0A813UQX0_9BILA|nr:unnamed protein product [Brachionus calyciflorus]